ncbi:MAG: AIPR family protein [Flavobacteriales bacterium]|nr:AIPR family protein [Flavobacteriales bacterium]MCB9194078.1 AIPR family protein [Flavobacteriales bacterium]
MTPTKIAAAHKELRREHGGLQNDYFGLVFLEEEYHVSRDQAIQQVAFGDQDSGIDGFHLDKRSVLLFIFKYGRNQDMFRDSYQMLLGGGVEQLFGDGPAQDPLLKRLRNKLQADKNAVDKVVFQFVFLGDPEEAERSTVLDKLREDLENKQYLINHFFGGRPVTMVVQYRSVTGRTSEAHEHRTRQFELELGNVLDATGPSGENMHVGFMRLWDLYQMHKAMGDRFFERNIRYGMPENSPANQAMDKAFKQILVDGALDASRFLFDHNGVTFSCERFAPTLTGKVQILEPRLLNGAQTIATISRFLARYDGHADINRIKDRLKRIRVMARVVSDATDEFVVGVTINNNRQTPIQPWNLRANDMIQLQLQDRFRTLGIFYERQERSFEAHTPEELEELGIVENKAIGLLKLAQTFLASEGEIDKMRSMRTAFQEDRIYEMMFSASRLNADPRHIVLCYKVQERLGRITREIVERGVHKYAFLPKARLLLFALMCQAILNDPDLERWAEDHGTDMVVSADYARMLYDRASAKCRPVISELIALPQYAPKVAEERFDFLRTHAAWKHAMTIANERHGWGMKRLR